MEYIKIASSKDLIAHIKREYISMEKEGTSICIIELSNPEGWSTVLKWGKLSLPRVGKYPYIPAGYQGDKFQRGKTKDGVSGYKDNQNCIWIWDKAHQNRKLHWHVLDSKGQRQHEITPDGRYL
ncbi:MAG TPA: hypothetical protein G4N98_07825 [Thermoflexia bacterium]|nr:hypothetical protein [Thermoflexia bacterium]